MEHTKLHDDPDDNITNDDSNVTEEEKNLLEEATESTPTDDDQDAGRATLDQTDEDGTPLNEQSQESDLDVPGSELDDAAEEIGEEDEENNDYSLPDDDKS